MYIVHLIHKMSKYKIKYIAPLKASLRCRIPSFTLNNKSYHVTTTPYQI